MRTLYNLSKQEAVELLSAFNNDVEALGVFLWNRHRAATLEKGIDKAVKLKRFINQ